MTITAETPTLADLQAAHPTIAKIVSQHVSVRQAETSEDVKPAGSFNYAAALRAYLALDKLETKNLRTAVAKYVALGAALVGCTETQRAIAETLGTSQRRINWAIKLHAHGEALEAVVDQVIADGERSVNAVVAAISDKREPVTPVFDADKMAADYLARLERTLTVDQVAAVVKALGKRHAKNVKSAK